MSAARECWLDLRGAGPWRRAVSEEAVHLRFDAIVADDPADLADLPPTVTRVLAVTGDLPGDLGNADLVLVDPATRATVDRPGVRFGTRVDVTDAESLELACERVRRDELTVLRFHDPTHIPLEIVLAAADGADGRIITEVSGIDEASVHLTVLERGPDGVLLRPGGPGDATKLTEVVRRRSPDLDLVTLTVTGVRHCGSGERACVDTCSYLNPDEGILVGSRSRGLLLCVSETHPLPYMPMRPFRVNAGAVMSYTLADHERTRYLCELQAGATVLAVRADGRSRAVTVGRVKIETRPLLAIDAVAPSGEQLNLIVQDDWHVRLLGPGGVVLNSTELKPGDEVLGYLPGRERHVGYPIDELCHEL
ncbi:3-dehydroquinate synthase II [Paractinoplanes toevensis]|uniref:3-dehydroquinate synthase II n=1 Tax=Paractinoplanes toevensis TaxID=571911 RepID=A0A919W7N5_9ACTN|nr:3-dehydroquinate synthase II [Actinoplanes toevensis]GIM89631.1 3-dehydroquinate synthase II [Actinoplanes toevensis]